MIIYNMLKNSFCKKCRNCKVYFFIVVLSFFSCSEVRNHFTGNYYRYSRYDEIMDKMEIHCDSSFKYIGYALIPINSEGNWHKDHGEIIFHSLKQPPKDSFFVIENELNDKGNVFIQIRTMLPDSQAVPFTEVCFNNDTNEIFYSDWNGDLKIRKEIVISKISIKHFILSNYQYCYKIKNHNANSFIFFVYDQSHDRTYRFFTNEKWIIRKNKLIQFSEGKKYIYYKN